MDAWSAICNDNYVDVTPDIVSVAIGNLKCDKACGSDRLFVEHYIHADSRLAVLLSTLFTGALTHGHIFKAYYIVPMIKTNLGIIGM